MQKKILAIDDDPINRQLMQIFLSSAFDCKVVSNTQQATEALSKESFDLVLTDINLGGEHDGVWLGKYMKSTEKFKHIPVIAITAHVMSYTGKEEITNAFDGLIQKPIIKDKLIAQLQLILEK